MIDVMQDSIAAGMVAGVRSQCFLMQNDDEIIPFVALLLSRPRHKHRAALEVGLERGGTHLLWRALFSKATSIEIDVDRRDDFLRRVPDGDVLLGHSTNPLILQHVAERAPFDLLFIDADHEYEAVKADYLALAKFVAPGGIVAWHDANQVGAGYGVKLFLERLHDGLEDGKVHTIKYCPHPTANIAYEVVP